MNAGQFVRSLHDSQFRRFLLTGVVNTLFGLSVYVCCILAGMQPWLAMIVGTVLGVAFNFLSFGSYAFRDLSIQRLPRFLLSYVVTYFFNLGAFHVLNAWIGSQVWTQVILTPLVALFSYLSMSNFVFRRHPAA